MKTINLAHVTSNGILFYSDKCPQIGTLAYFDDSNEIKTKKVFTKIYELEDFLTSPSKPRLHIKKKNIVIFNVLLFLFFGIIAILTMNFHFLSATLYFSILISSDFLFVISKIIDIKSINTNNFSKGRFHSAEHMILSAYSDLQKIPTLDEAKRYSRFSKYCGSRFVFSKVAIYTLVSILMAIHPYIGSVAYLTLLCALCILFIIDHKTGILRFLQIFVTSKPNDAELLLAIEGVRQHEITEEQISNNLNAVIAEIVESFEFDIFEISEPIDASDILDDE